MAISPLPPVSSSGVSNSSAPIFDLLRRTSAQNSGTGMGFSNSQSTTSSFFSRLTGSGAGLFNGISNALRGIGMNLYDGVSQIGSGLGQLFDGSFGSGLLSIGKGLFSSIVQTPIDAVLMGGGSLLGSFQTLFGIEPVGRPLGENEISSLSRVYGDSVDLSSVLVKEGNIGLFGITDRAFTLGNTIYVPPGSLDGVPHASLNLLVHEMAHVWQHQNGGTDYLSEALWAQKFGDGYDFEKGIADGLSWSQLNPEQQAELIQIAHGQGFFDNSDNTFNYFGTDFSQYMQDAWANILSGLGAP